MIEAHGLVKRYGSTMAVVIEITGMDSAEVGRLAAAHGIALSELIPVRASLEEAFMELTQDSVEYQAAGATR